MHRKKSCAHLSGWWKYQYLARDGHDSGSGMLTGGSDCSWNATNTLDGSKCSFCRFFLVCVAMLSLSWLQLCGLIIVKGSEKGQLLMSDM